MHYQRWRRGETEEQMTRPRQKRANNVVIPIDFYQRTTVPARKCPTPAPPPPWGPQDIPIAIVTHEGRAAHAQILAEKIGAEAMSVDDIKMGCEANHRRTWSWLASGNARWSVILEDDVVVAPAFRFQLAQILTKAPTPIVSLYLGRGRPPHHQGAIATAITSLPSENTCFLLGKDLLSAQGYAVHTNLLSTFLAATTDRPDVPIDEQFSAVARGLEIPISYTWPSIVDHREDLAPVISTRADGQARTERRVAWKFGGRHSWFPDAAPLREPEELGMTVIRA